LDVAASSFYDGGKKAYVYKREGVTRDPGEQLEFIVRLIDTYGLLYVEDPLHEEDFAGFAELTRKVGKKCLICGDDLFVTNVERIKRGIEGGAANAVLIKPDETIAHLAVAWGIPLIKTGAVGGERIAKLNELIRIEERLGDRARMAKLPFK
jgi:enolase